MKNKPNILFIITDQLRADCIGIEKKHPVLTPTINSIAGAGARFEKCYTTCPTCIAARRSILSGQFPHNHGMVGYEEKIEWDIDDTLPAILRRAGYQTYFAGRDMHQYPKRKRFGYDHMVILDDYRAWLAKMLPKTDTSSGGSAYHETGVKHNDYTARPWPYDEYMHSTNWTVNEAKQFFEKHDPTVPWFFTISFLAPHPPLIPPQFYMDRYLRTGVRKPVIGSWATPPENEGLGLDQGITCVDLKGEVLLSARAAYYGLINQIDDQLRRIINPIDGISLLNKKNSADLVNGKDRDTIVIFTSDHGEMLGDHYRWHKIMPYEGSARIPLLISAPDSYGIKNNTIVKGLACLEDIMPTVLEMVGVEAPDGIDGRSLLVMMQGKTGKVRDYLHLEHAPIYHALTDGKNKYVWFVKDGTEQLFDLENDPEEMEDIATDQVRLTGEFRKLLSEELKNRPEGFSDGKILIPGREYSAVIRKNK